MNYRIARRAKPLLVGIFTVLAIGSSGRAGTLWDGGGTDDFWTTIDNWDDNLAPLPGIGTGLTFAGASRLSGSNDFTAGSDFGAINFDSTAGAFALVGNAIRLNGDVTNNSSAAQAIGFDMALVGHRLFSTNSGNLTLGGTLSGAGSFEKTGTGMTILSVANSYTGGTTVTAGNLRINDTGALGSGALVLQGGSFGTYNATTNADVMTIANAVEVRGDVSLYAATSVSSRSRVMALGNVTTFGERTISYVSPGGYGGTQWGHVTMESLTLGGNTILNASYNNYRANLRIKSLSDGGAGYDLTKRGNGTVELVGDNTNFAGNITIEAGHIRVRSVGALGTGTVTMRNGTQLGTVDSIDVSSNPIRIEDGTVPSYSVSLYAAGNSSNETATFGPVTTVGSGTINVVHPIYGGIPGEAALVYATNRTGSVVVQSVTLGGDTTFSLSNIKDTTIGTLTINGAMTDGGAGYAVTKSGAGNMRLNGAAPSGNIRIAGGVLSFANGHGATFSRSLGAGIGEFQIASGTNGGIGSSVDEGLTVTLGSGTVTWGSTYFDPTNLYLNEVHDTGNLTFTNAVDLGGEARSIYNASTTGVATLSGIVSNGGVAKHGPGVLVLSNLANTFAGALSVYSGTLQLASLADGGVGSNGGGAISLGNANTSATLRYTGSSPVSLSAARPIQIGSGTGTGGGALENNAADPAANLTISNIATASTGSDKTLILGGSNTGDNVVISIAASADAKKLSLVKTGSGVWHLAGGTIDLGGGDVTVQQGSLNLGSVGSLNNFGVLSVGSNHPEAPQTMTGAAGGTYALSGSTIRIGYRTGAVGTATDKCEGVLDLSAMASFTASVGSFELGTHGSTADGSASQGTVMLAANNSITATTRVILGTSYGDIQPVAGTLNRLTFGEGTNTLVTPTVIVGGAKCAGSVDIRPGGTLTLGNGASGADLNISYDTGYSRESHFDMSGGTFIANLDDVYLGYKNANSAGPSGTATKGILTLGPSQDNDVTIAKLYVGKTGASARSNSVTGELNMAGGTMDVTQELQIGYQANRTPTHGTVNLAGGALSVASGILVGYRSTATNDGNNTAAINVSGGVLTVVGDVALATWISNAPGTVSGSLNLTGGVTTINGDITTTVNQSQSNATVTLDGGILDLTDGTISADTFNLRSGILRNVAEIYDGAGSITFLNKTTAGLAVLEGVMGYSGVTTVNSGTLLVDGALSGSSLVTVGTDGILGGRGSITSIVTVDGTITGGDVGTIGTLEIYSALALSSSSTSVFDIGTAGSDHIVALTSLSYGGILTLQLSGEISAGVYDLFEFALPWDGFSTFANLNLPTLPNGLEWKDYGDGFHFDYSTGQVEVIPEPGTATLFTFAAAGLLLGLRRRRTAV